jgi:hypothetical protein
VGFLHAAMDCCVGIQAEPTCGLGVGGGGLAIWQKMLAKRLLAVVDPAPLT